MKIKVGHALIGAGFVCAVGAGGLYLQQNGVTGELVNEVTDGGIIVPKSELLIPEPELIVPEPEIIE